MTDISVDQIKVEFLKNSGLKGTQMDIMEKCATLCNMNKYTPKQLANDCEALLINESGDVQSDAMTLQLFGKLEQVIQKKKYR